MAEKKMGPREAELRALREKREDERVKANKAKIDRTTKFKAKGIGKVVNLKGKRGQT
jgi:hypothetical protein